MECCLQGSCFYDSIVLVSVSCLCNVTGSKRLRSGGFKVQSSALTEALPWSVSGHFVTQFYAISCSLLKTFTDFTTVVQFYCMLLTLAAIYGQIGSVDSDAGVQTVGTPAQVTLWGERADRASFKGTSFILHYYF